MTGRRYPGPLGTTYFEPDDWFGVDDGTLPRQRSPRPGILDQCSLAGGSPAAADSMPPITAAEMLAIVPQLGPKAAATAADINQVVKDAGITSRLGQAMLIAQLAVETGYFENGPTKEGNSRVVYNIKSGKELKRLADVHVWRASKKSFEDAQAKKAFAEFKADNLGIQVEQEFKTKEQKAREAAPKDLGPRRLPATEYVVGDEEYDYLEYMYDMSSPNPGRVKVAVSVLGNTQKGDGKLYCGRGYIQLTGRSNYAQASRALKLDLVSKPDDAMIPSNAVRIAGWFWKTRGCNALTGSDTADNFQTITEKINGGLTGQTDRVVCFHAAKLALGLEKPPTPMYWPQEDSPKGPFGPMRLHPYRDL
jgi:putative chitinase